MAAKVVLCGSISEYNSTNYYFVIDGLANNQKTDDPEHDQALEAGICPWCGTVLGWLKKVGRAFVQAAVCSKCLLTTSIQDWGNCGSSCWNWW